ncbi:3,4-dihydroxy-2-butanone-4-phosphate synthase [Paraburkholderia sp. J67]|uniref:3,4-dihydroxy-2-butanone-4-phosphate synthase n=1 Tax=Paraburkholderia sp. J67 TaxID=2805435 RepID=UPI002ABDC239|nr:3,4-dihydroxy-2-butanone-4-phosphate synthase [Paraburkholderia sp. J67]
MSNDMIAIPEELIEEARNGRMFILVDDEDRENEGDLVMPAQMATPEAINFMSRHGRGLICLALTRARVEQLGLPLMEQHNQTLHETAFTVSIEARDGVTTGISAGDRARTIAAAIDASKGAEHIVRPGHVFPLIARDGGVLVRAGHTEAAVDIARLAGLNASGVICEIMREDGTMARMNDLMPFAREHGMKIGTIRSLIAYRMKRDQLVEQTAEAQFNSVWGGVWTAKTFVNKALGTEQIALVKGQIHADQPTLVRMHALSIFPDTFGEAGAGCTVLQDSMKAIAAAGSGVVIVINRPTVDTLFRDVRARARKESHPTPELRDYGIGAQILSALNVQKMVLLTNSHHAPVALAGYGLEIVEERPVVSDHVVSGH